MTVWFTSDLHFGHSKILQYSNRPFKDVIHMNEMLIQNWNERVKPGDRVYCLGDFCLGDEDLAIASARRLNGNRYLVWGNHDKRLRKSKAFMDQWVWCKDLEKIEVEGQKIVLCHYALLTWDGSHKGNYSLHGHSHGSLPDDPHALRIDVGVDCFDYAPASFEQIKARMSKKTWKAIDHHDKRDL